MGPKSERRHREENNIPSFQTYSSSLTQASSWAPRTLISLKWCQRGERYLFHICKMQKVKDISSLYSAGLHKGPHASSEGTGLADIPALCRDAD